ncbi:MAG: hypothetical protein Q7R64_04140 [bacterium]|nr:hypothetical protein [bacterium]
MVKSNCEVVARSAATVASIFGKEFVNGTIKVPLPKEGRQEETQEFREARLRNEMKTRYFLRTTAETEQYPFAS